MEGRSRRKLDSLETGQMDEVVGFSVCRSIVPRPLTHASLSAL